MRFENELEAATMPTGETARQYGRRGQRPHGSLLEKEIRMIQAGARQCDWCGLRPGHTPTGRPDNLRAICEHCKLDLRAERQRSTREAMRRRA